MPHIYISQFIENFLIVLIQQSYIFKRKQITNLLRCVVI